MDLLTYCLPVFTSLKRAVCTLFKTCFQNVLFNITIGDFTFKKKKKIKSDKKVHVYFSEDVDWSSKKQPTIRKAMNLKRKQHDRVSEGEKSIAKKKLF